MAETKIDPEIRIRPSKDLLRFVRNYIDKDALILPKDLLSNETFSISDVTWIQNYMSKNRDELRKICPEFRHFHELMAESVMILPEPQFPPRNPELEARIQKLKVQQAERDYKRMTQNVSGRAAYTEEPISNQMQEMNSHLIMVLQLVVSVVTAFVFGYMAPYFFYGMEPAGPRILIGIFCAFVVGLADLYFVIRFLLETEGNIKRPTLPSTLEEDESTTTIAAEKKSGTAVPKSAPTVEKSEPEVSKPKLD